MDELVQVIRDDEARVNITFAGQNGELPQPVFFQSSDADVKAWVTEAVRNGGVPGIRADANADFRDYVVDRFPPTEARPHNLLQIRPKTAFGVSRAIGDSRDLQDVLNAVYQGAAKECEGREHEGKLVGNGHHMAQAIVANVEIELLNRGLFTKFE